MIDVQRMVGTGGAMDYGVLAEREGARLGVKPLPILKHDAFVLGLRVRSAGYDESSVAPMPETLKTAWPDLAFKKSDAKRASLEVLFPFALEHALQGERTAAKIAKHLQSAFAVLEGDAFTLEVEKYLAKAAPAEARVTDPSDLAAWVRERCEATLKALRSDLAIEYGPGVYGPSEADQEAQENGTNVVPGPWSDAVEGALAKDSPDDEADGPADDAQHAGVGDPGDEH